MRMIVFIVAGLVVGLGGGTAFRGLKERDAILARLAEEHAATAAAAEHGEVNASHGEPSQEDGAVPTGTESLAGHEAVQDSATSGEEELPSAAGTESPEGSPAPSDSEEPSGQESGSPFSLAQTAAWSAGSGTPAQEGSARLAKIFGAMQAKDAAAVLEKLEDGEVQAILFHLSDRKAAEILGSFSPERAATLSRTVLGSRNGKGS